MNIPEKLSDRRNERGLATLVGMKLEEMVAMQFSIVCNWIWKNLDLEDRHGWTQMKTAVIGWMRADEIRNVRVLIAIPDDELMKIPGLGEKGVGKLVMVGYVAKQLSAAQEMDESEFSKFCSLMVDNLLRDVVGVVDGVR